jgi:crotonobetainyl-CoA:carnitine CoA-transferase CaiB-like acyl-CoA transferase
MQGPHCSQMLGDMGAEVIKVERLGTGDENRAFPFNRIRGVNAFFLALNRNKRSLTLDLKQPRGREVIHRLIPACDVLLENFRPGTMEKLGLGYEEVSRRNPRMIYCSCSGYGQDGPYRDKPGQDLLAQAMSGLAWVTGRTNGCPRAAGTYAVDAYGAMLAAVGILAALQARERTGKGQKIEVCLLDAALHMQCQELTFSLNGGEFLPRASQEIAHPLEPAPYGIYETADRAFLAVSSGPWPNLCRALEMPELERDPRFDSAQKRLQLRGELYDVLGGAFKRQPRIHWLERLARGDVWCAPVYTYEEVERDPQVVSNGMIITQGHPENGEFRVIANPIRMSLTPPTYRTPPPPLGADTEAILTGLGFHQEEIDRLREEGVV